MPLRYVRTKLSADNALSVALVTTAVTRELADMLQFPPAKAAASVLSLVFETIQHVQTNRSDCYRLARRCLSLLVDIRDQMGGRWEDAPESLLTNFKKIEKILQSIHEYMKGEAEQKWHNRLLRKSAIEDAIADFCIQLDDAARSFQIATLISIHYAIGDKVPSQVFPKKDVIGAPHALVEVPQDGTALSARDLHDSTIVVNSTPSDNSSFLVSGSRENSMDDFVLVTEPEELVASISDALPAASLTEEPEELDNRGFRQYLRSEVVLTGRSQARDGWWAGTTKADIGGRTVLSKTYEGSNGKAVKKWLRDVRILQNVYHPNLPQMIGYSGVDTPTPFIVLANVQTRLPQALVLEAIKKASLASCAQVLLRFYRDTMDAALYLQRQLNLSNSKTQDYVENASFRIDFQQTLIMGLPPPEIDAVVSWRNFGLAHSIRELYLALLPNRGYARQPFDPKEATNADVQRKVNHLAMLARALLPSSENLEVVSARIKAVLEDDDCDEDEEHEEHSPSLNLRQIRLAAIHAKAHNHSWNQNSISAHRFKVGDLGYVPDGEDFESFVWICNVVENHAAIFEIHQQATGWQGCWENGLWKKQKSEPYVLPGEIQGWAMAVPPGTDQSLQVVHEEFVEPVSDAWKFLLDNGNALAEAHNIKSEELILVTRAGTDQTFKIIDRRIIPHMMNHHHTGPATPFGTFSGHGSGLPGHLHGHYHAHMHHGIPGQHLMPAIFYLFTSLAKDHEPYWSESPMHLPLPEGAQRAELKSRCLQSTGWKHGFMNYVQLHAEDFVT